MNASTCSRLSAVVRAAEWNNKLLERVLEQSEKKGEIGIPRPTYRDPKTGARVWMIR